MSTEDLEKAIRIIEANPQYGQFVGARDASLIVAAERALDGKFPPIYRRFLARFGAGNFGGSEFYGVIDDDFQNSGVPDAVWMTLQGRREGYVPFDFVVVGTSGYGPHYCISLGQGGAESPVYLYWPAPAASRKTPEILAEDFGRFLLDEVSKELEA